MRLIYSKVLKERAVELISVWGVAKTSLKTGIPEPNLKRWRSKGTDRKKGSGRKIKHPELEVFLVNYIRDLRDQNVAVRFKKVIPKARNYCRVHKIEDLKLSQGWVHKFCKRNNLVRRRKTKSSSKNSNTLLPEVLAFKKKFVEEVLDGDLYDHDQVINMDETSITRDAPSNYTLERKGVTSVPLATTGEEKTSYTLALSVTLNGEKLRSVLIWPGTGTKSKKIPIPDNLFLYYREKSWMNKKLLIQWVKDVLAKRKRKLKGKRGSFLIDGVSFHKDKEVRTNNLNLNYLDTNI
jgi:hypothetical protein